MHVYIVSSIPIASPESVMGSIVGIDSTKSCFKTRYMLYIIKEVLDLLKDQGRHRWANRLKIIAIWRTQKQFFVPSGVSTDMSTVNTACLIASLVTNLC